ncbi:MAG: hypothetical protein IPP36_01325 [Nitrosomonadales bacterium]|nr:hypothetical protein [Nitrosomonadales bacterium]
MRHNGGAQHRDLVLQINFPLRNPGKLAQYTHILKPNTAAMPPSVILCHI